MMLYNKQSTKKNAKHPLQLFVYNMYKFGSFEAPFWAYW